MYTREKTRESRSRDRRQETGECGRMCAHRNDIEDDDGNTEVLMEKIEPAHRDGRRKERGKRDKREVETEK